jgi:hypothetical protein
LSKQSRLLRATSGFGILSALSVIICLSGFCVLSGLSYLGGFIDLVGRGALCNLDGLRDPVGLVLE